MLLIDLDCIWFDDVVFLLMLLVDFDWIWFDVGFLADVIDWFGFDSIM